MIKTSWNRLLDLTWGWYAYVEAQESREEEPLTDDLLPAQELFDLYQALGAQAFEVGEDGVLLPGTEAEIRVFLSEKVLPLLMRQATFTP